MFLGDLCVDKFHPSAPTADGSPSFNDLLASLSASLRPDDSWLFGQLKMSTALIAAAPNTLRTITSISTRRLNFCSFFAWLFVVRLPQVWAKHLVLQVPWGNATRDQGGTDLVHERDRSAHMI